MNFQIHAKYGNLSLLDCYRPHPKNGEGNIFSLSVSSHPGGTQLPLGSRGYHILPNRGYPHSTRPGDTPILPDWGMLPSFPTLPKGATPSFMTGGSPSPIRTGWGYTLLGLDGGNPPSQLGLDGLPPTPPPLSADRETE